MTPDDVRRRILAALVRVAPEVDPETVRPEAVLRDEYDLDSMDFLNFVIGLHEGFGIDIPESDYPALATLAGCEGYVRAHTAPPPASRGSRPAHRFEATLQWTPQDGSAMLAHVVSFTGRPDLAMSAPPQFHGDGTRLSPEELFVASLASCQLLTYLALAKRAGVAVARYEDHAVATLAAVDRGMRITEVVLRPRIVVAPGGDAAKARALVDAAHDACFVARSITSAVRIEPEVVVA
ncbi:MAG TPA: OsmC family protein [Candidatus Eisenbacteria bacterium]|nr:OsmC family protein [Candidatus Eisenbacteria bacterium]